MRYLIIGAFAEATCRHRRSSLPTALAYLMPRTSPTRPIYFKRDSEPFLLFAQFDVGVLGGAPYARLVSAKRHSRFHLAAWKPCPGITLDGCGKCTAGDQGLCSGRLFDRRNAGAR